jgi:putative ABC transport system substrate-binding protein
LICSRKIKLNAIDGRGTKMKKKSIGLILALLLFVSFDSVKAQQSSKTVPQIGFISSTGTPEHPSPLLEAFRQGLRDLGYVDGKNITIVHRYAEGRLDRMPPYVQEFVQQKIDIIIGVNNVVIRAAKEATKSIPIVMVSSVDPVAAGYVESFAHPGGNITGLAWLNRDISAKRLELLKELFPKLSQAAILWDADGPGPAAAFKEYTAAAPAFKMDLRSLEVRGPTPDFTEAFRTGKNARSEAIIVVGNPLMSQYLKLIFAMAMQHRLPTMTEEDRYVQAGGLISYGANFADLYRRAAGYVVEILKGAKPGDLQVKLPEKFEIFVNLKTAKEIGVVIPQHVLLQADKIIK